jgi:alcohol dehydrogenase
MGGTLMNDAPELIFGAGSLARVREVIAAYAPERILLVGSAAAMRRSGIERYLPTASHTYSGFCPNPRLEDVLAGCEVAAAYKPDVVVGVGGGSSMDTAKLLRVLPPGTLGRRAVLQQAVDLLRTDAPPLVLVPTVSGSGSEMTRFATVYSDGRKYSVDHKRVLATISIVDMDLAATCPAPIALSCVLDALAHAVESYWSLRSTAVSRLLAGQALTLLRRMGANGRQPLDTTTRAQVADAAIRAGRAIDMTRTTAAHAFAYPTTVRFGVPHGLACGLHLIWLLDHVAAQAERDCSDPRGPQFVTARLAEIAALLGAGHPRRSASTLESLVTSFGFASRLASYGVTAADIPPLTAEALNSARATNVPVQLHADAVHAALRKRL